jgi:hypothetical protein
MQLFVTKETSKRAASPFFPDLFYAYRASLAHRPFMQKSEEVGAVIGDGNGGITPPVTKGDQVTLMTTAAAQLLLLNAPFHKRVGDIRPAFTLTHLKVSRLRHAVNRRHAFT